MTSAEAAYIQLTKMIEHEIELARQGKVRALREAVLATGEFMATLPSPAPAAARPTLHRAEALRGRLAIETRRLQERIRIQRASRRNARKLARTYTGPQPPARRGYSTTV